MPASLVVQTSFIGDVILTTPLIAKLAEGGPVDVVTTPAGAGVLRNNPWVRSVTVYDKRGVDGGVRGFLGAAIRARRSGDAGPPGRTYGSATVLPGGPASPSLQPSGLHSVELHGGVGGRLGWSGFRDRCRAVGPGNPTTPADRRRAYLAQGSLRSAAFAVAAGCRERIGFASSDGRALYTERVEYRDDWHHARRLLSLACPAYAGDVSNDELRPRVYPGDDDVAAVDALWGVPTRPVVALAPGSVWATKRWPYYTELARLLAARFDVAIVGGDEDVALTREIVGVVGDARVIDAVGRLSLLGSAELIRRAVVLVTNDSAPQHLASAVGTPTVAVFGPTVPAFGFGPLAPASVTVGQDALACRPCDRHGPRRCPLGHWKCMREVGAERVYEVVMDVIHEGGTR